jgi:hypothetical protein
MVPVATCTCCVLTVKAAAAGVPPLVAAHEPTPTPAAAITAISAVRRLCLWIHLRLDGGSAATGFSAVGGMPGSACETVGGAETGASVMAPYYR